MKISKLYILLALPFLMICSLSGAQELKRSVTWENLRAHPAPLPIAGELKAVHSSLEAPSCWSVGVETMDRDYADFEQFKHFVGETGVGFGRKGEAVGCLLWLSGARPSDTLDRVCMDVSLKGLKLEDPVYVDLLTGYIHEISALKISGGFKDLPLWDSPVLIIERSAILF